MSSTQEDFDRDGHLMVSKEALDEFSENVGSLWCPSFVPLVEREMTPLGFCRDFVSKSRPCILRNNNMGRLLPRWTVEDILTRCGNDLEITVNVTPDGHGDEIRTVQLSSEDQPLLERAFVLPEERRMKLQDFVRELRAPSARASASENHLGGVDMNGLSILGQRQEGTIPSTSVYYYSMQNDCLRTECSALSPPLASSSVELLTWAGDAFGTGPPDALNIWVGKQDATSSLHKDHYENLFYVASGQKVFTIYPPADAAFLEIETLATSRFEFVNTSATSTSSSEEGCWKVVPEMQADGSRCQTPWIAAPSAGASAQLHPIRVEVQAGDILYLPALWFHQVTQTCETVAINWWFDMHFDSPLWCYFRLLESSRLVMSMATNNKNDDEE